ncbi:hemerythrin domain-containing protein [Cryobacterium adonitolivorans]|uniref:Hemerythrin domain-containing protein n=1 Tax=Cryobacterium adonitolivorans TaxID=1259189 RepID=A0A4R8W3X4_9MICO|nr:hemerythrin domain-containing protein [Cryobacterium adonitolivorans]TFC01662.1 hemerythrin domain-containing protein [Cryobacterium adonitolivorans]
MPATSLPSSGENPDDGTGIPSGATKICDARGMAEIHRMFRAGFGEGPALIGGVPDTDADQADIVGDFLAMLSTGLHAHHEGEDTLLWGRLETRAPSCAVHVTRMKEQHAQMLVHLEELDASLPAWRASGRATDAASVATALAGINAALAVHLPDEEAHIVPVMETVITPREVDELSEHGRKATPKGKMFVQLGTILAAQPDGGEDWQHEHLPAPVRLLWRLVGKSKYERYRATLVK